MQINATHVEADPDDDEHCALLFFRERLGRYVSLARWNLKEDDKGLEIEINEQSRSARNCIDQCFLHADKLYLRLKSEFETQLGVTEVTVVWPSPSSELHTIRLCLNNIFRDGPEFQDCSK